MTGLLTFDRLTKHHTTGTAHHRLGPLTLSLKTERIIAILGPSGSGKTTLLRLVAGLEQPTAGSIRLDGKPIDTNHLGVVFQEPRLMPWLTVAQNVGFGLRGMDKKRRDAAVTAAIDIMGLHHVPDKLPKHLSGGMAQRTALARALAINPRLLLMDEPFSALDPRTRGDMQRHLLTIAAHYRPTILFVTHDLDEALILADHILVLNGSPTTIVGDYRLTQTHPRDGTDPACAAIRAEILKIFAQDPQRSVNGS